MPKKERRFQSTIMFALCMILYYNMNTNNLLLNINRILEKHTKTQDTIKLQWNSEQEGQL